MPSAMASRSRICARSWNTATFATGVVGVLPTVTFPSHTTLVTGASPAEHGMLANTPFDPLNANRDGWYWYAEDVRVPTLWSAAAARELTTASVNWSVTVANRDIDYLIPEFWRAVNDEDVKLLRALSRPEGLLERLEAKLGPFVNGYDGRRSQRTSCARSFARGDPARAPARPHGRAFDRARRHRASRRAVGRVGPSHARSDRRDGRRPRAPPR